MVEVAFGELRDGRKGVNIDDQLFLAVSHDGEAWNLQLFDLFDNLKPLTYTVKLLDYRDLDTSRKATVLRKVLKRHIKNEDVLNSILLQIEIHEDQFKNVEVEAEDENKKTSKFPSVIEEQIKAEVQKILEAENQLEALKPHLDNVICGEDENKQAILVLLAGSKYDDFKKKSIILLKGTEGGGKSTLATELSRLFKTKEVGRFSSHALDYSNLEGYEILYLKELGNMDLEKQGVSTLKFLSADDKGYTVEITVRDSETGEFTTKSYQIPAISVISTTTRLILDSQFERRAWLFNVDESKEQTERVKKWKAEQKKQEDEKVLGLRKLTDYEFSREVLKRFVEQLKPRKIIIPFRETLTDFLDAESLRLRSDIDKVHTFVELYALFNLKRLQKITNEVYAVTPEIAIEALKLIEKPLTNMLSLMDERLKPLIEKLKEMQFKAYDTITKDDREKIAVQLGKSEKTIRDYLNYLENRGLVGGDNKKPKSHTLLYKLEDIEAKLSGISAKLESADSLMEKMREEARKWLNPQLEIPTSENVIYKTQEKCKNDIPNMPKGISDMHKKHETASIYNSSYTVPISNPEITEKQPSLNEKTSENWQNEESPIFYKCPICEAKGKRVFFGSQYDLELHKMRVHGVDNA